MTIASFSQAFALAKEMVTLQAKVTIGASGAPTLDTTAPNSTGIASIVRDSAGVYTLTLSRAYRALLGANFTFMSSSGIPAAPSVGLKSATDVTATTPVVKFTCSTAGGGAATDPGNGETMLISLLVTTKTYR